MNGKFFKTESGGFRAGLYFTLFMAAFLFFSIVLQAVSSEIFNKGSAAYFALTCLSAPLAFFTVLIISKTVFSEEVKNLCKVNGFSRVYTGIAVILTFGMLFGLGFVNGVFVDFLESLGMKVGGIEPEMNNAGEYILCIVSLCVIPAVFEELFFRGVVLSSLKNAGFIVSAVISALFFAFYHCSPAQFIYQLVFGFFLALMTLRAGNIYPAVISHFLNNFAVLSFTYFNIGIDLLYLPFILIGLIFIAAFCLVLFLFKSGRTGKIKGETFSAFFPFGIFSLLACSAIIIAGMFI